MSNESQSIVRTRWGIALLLLLLFGAACLYFYYFSKCIDGCGPYHYTTSVADLDGDGVLDVLLSGRRHESETIFWAGSTLWINEGMGKFTAQGVGYGGPSTTTGDVDRDGDIDVVGLVYRVTIFLNQGGWQGGIPGDLKQWQSIAPQVYRHDYSSLGTVVLADLNSDDRQDVLLSYCCSTVVDKQDDFLPFLPWVWINTLDETGSLKGKAFYLNSLGDLPMRPTLGDLDGDGDLDIYAASLPPKKGNYDPSDRILLNDGSGAFVDSGQRLDNTRKAGAAGSGAVALGDLDSDNDLDAVVATAKGTAIWMNQGGAQGGQLGVFAESRQPLGRGHIEAIFLADFDADSDLDALVAGIRQATIWWNDGQAGFHDSKQRLTYTERHGLAVSDFNDDGYLDVFSAANDEFHLWLNQGDGQLQAHD